MRKLGIGLHLYPNNFPVKMKLLIGRFTYMYYFHFINV
jgi:hypothetical protein